MLHRRDTSAGSHLYVRSAEKTRARRREFIERGSCCGLPELDMGYIKHSCSLEKGIVSLISDKGYDYVVLPSGICTDQFRDHFTEVEQTLVAHFRATVHDPMEFLRDILKIHRIARTSSVPLPCGTAQRLSFSALSQ